MKRVFLTAADIVLVILEALVLSGCWQDSGVRMFRYYTQDSNALAMLVGAVCAAAGIVSLARGKLMPGWTRVLRHVSASCLMVTFLVAAFVLVPMERQHTFSSFMLEGELLYLHTVCPLMMPVLLYLHDGPRLGARHAALALIPTVVYGVVTLVMNARRVYAGPYPFLRIYAQPAYMTALWCAVIVLCAFCVAWTLAAVSGIGQKRKGEEKR